MRAVLIAAVLMLAPVAAGAASFDCAKARSPAEKAICADPALSRADDALAAAYARAVANSPTPASLRREQQAWLRYDRGDKAAELRTSIPDRTASLAARAKADLVARRPIPISQIGKVCAPVLTAPSCKVVESGLLRRPTASKPGLWWQTIKADDDFGEAGTVVLQAPQGSPTAAAAVWTATEGGVYEAAKIVGSPAGPLLHLPGYMSGTGYLNEEAVFQEQAPGVWREIDTQGWLAVLDRRLPKGLGVWKGVYVDFADFTAASPLWKGDDGNCCPTGGAVAAKVTLQGDKLVLTDAKVTLGEDAARGD